MSRDRTVRNLVVFLVAIGALGSLAISLWPSRDDARTTPVTAHAGSGAAAAPRPAIVTCDSLNQLHADTIRATDAAYARALADRGLRVVNLPAVATEGRAMPPDDQVHTFERGGHRFTFVPAASYASTHSVPSTAVLVTDGTGNVWKVKRAPRVRPVHQATVEACSYGCWGDPGAGVEPWEWSEHWVLGEAHRYQGEIEIAYDAPTIDLTIIDQDCPLPP